MAISKQQNVRKVDDTNSRVFITASQGWLDSYCQFSLSGDLFWCQSHWISPFGRLLYIVGIQDDITISEWAQNHKITTKSLGRVIIMLSIFVPYMM